MSKDIKKPAIFRILQLLKLAQKDNLNSWKTVISHLQNCKYENIDQKDENGHTLLWYAVCFEHIEATDKLLKLGADPKTIKDNSQTLFSYNLLNCGPTEISYLLFKKDNSLLSEEHRYILYGFRDDKFALKMLENLDYLHEDSDRDSQEDSYPQYQLTPFQLIMLEMEESINSNEDNSLEIAKIGESNSSFTNNGVN